MTPTDAIRARFRRRVDELAPDLRKRAYAAFEMVRESLTERELAAAVENGSVEALIGELLNDQQLDPAFRSLRNHLDRVTADTAALEAGNLPARFRTDFNRVSPALANAVHTMSGRVIDTLKKEIRDTVRQQVTEGLVAGKNPRVIAKALRKTIGMAPNQARNVDTFEV